ncbi:PAS domain-containing sensor histidine kinase [Arthrobacter sp. NamB2]|uniref:sensor histidine kinase n=1 Tax=Arthrobacter sp. NamB2 TaxID=2576035 RepID=UPI0010C9E571|nr:ATP-binding protein [Arthrobacter sp. NamB2]TKV26109.1 PAS domain-containing sensor histidine kinase [Arthrobacter sp. NamB2]
MDKVLSYLTLNTRQFHELSLRARVVLSQLPLSMTVLLILAGGLLFHPDLFESQAFLVGVGLQALLLAVCVLVPWDRLPYASFLVIPLLDFIPIGFMRHGAGTIITGVGLLAVFPVIWLAASGLFPRAALAAGFLASLGIVWVPVFVTDDAITSQSLTQSVLLPFIMFAIGMTIRVMTASMMAQQEVVETKDRALQALLEESARRERLLDTVVNSVDIGLIALDETGRQVLANRKLEQFKAIAGGTRETAEADLQVFQQDGRSPLPEVRRPTRRAAEGQVFSDYLLWWGERPNQRVLSTSSRLLLNQSGAREGSVVTFNDVTELVTALNAKDEFVATVSHELRTPLTAIRGYLELLTSMPDLEPDVASGLEVVSRNSERLHKLVVDLLSTAEGSPEISVRPTDFSALVTERVSAAQERNTNPLVRFEVHAEPDLVAMADAPRVSQVLDNLLSNAVKYSPGGGRVSVHAAEVDGEVECSVTDEGSGMSAEELRGVFSKFFRTSAARNAAIPGVGLGLALSKAIVERHGGTITCRSVEGQGSTFTFRLPLAHADQQQLQPQEP